MGRFVPEAPLFAGNALRGVLFRQIEQMQSEVLHELPHAQLLNAPEEALLDYLVDRYTLDLISLDMHGARRDTFEANVPVHHPLAVNARYGGSFAIGTVHNLEIPYSGHKSFFRVQPSRHPNEFPLGYEEQDKLVITIYGTNWPAPGSEDTELGVLMELEVGHGETEVYARVQA